MTVAPVSPGPDSAPTRAAAREAALAATSAPQATTAEGAQTATADASAAAATTTDAPRVDDVTAAETATPTAMTQPAPATRPAPPVPPAPPLPTEPAAAAAATRRLAFTWVDDSPGALPATPGTQTVTAPTAVAPAYVTDLLPRRPRRSPWRAGVLVPVGIVAALVGAYCAATLLWPLHAIAPTVTAVDVQSITAPGAAPAWPAAGSAAVAVDGLSLVSSSPDPAEIASITKVVTALLVLDEMPLAVGEQGPDFRFTASDRTAYWGYRSDGESALDVPVGGTLSEYQLLEGMLVGSANNYADRLAGNIWPSDKVFAAAAETWLNAHGVPGVTIVDPTGIEAGNTASPGALIALAERALENPVIAQIVAQPQIDLPGAGVVTNTNDLLADPGVIGVKTGSLDSFNLLSAKNITVGATTVRLYASVLGQPDDATRVAASRALYAQLEKELQPLTSVAAGTVAGVVNTRWGEEVDVVTAADAPVILWNGGSGTVTTTYSLGESRSTGDAVGTLSVAGPLDSATVDLALAADIPDPSPWWRLTHPLDLFGLAG